MLKRYLLFSLVIIAGCSRPEPDSYMTNEKAKAYFAMIKASCDRDGGDLWGINLYGPVMMIDRTSRKIIANRPDSEGVLRERDGVYTGFYPRELVINNTSVFFGKTQYAVVPLPQQEDQYRIITRAIRALFKCFKDQTGYSSTGYNTSNMDEKNARLWLKLEWNALRKAINSEGEEQRVAIRDAMIFRGSIRELYPRYAADAIRFENYEGLANFTSILLAADYPEEVPANLLENLDRMYGLQSYARSYGFISGALYAWLLYAKDFDFSVIRSENIDPAEIVRDLYNIELPLVCRDVSGSVAMNYDLEKVKAEETEHEKLIRELRKRQISIYTDRPVVFLELESPYFDFEPEDIHPIDTLGTIYTRMRISDNWGKLTVEEGGCLVSNNLSHIRITARGFREDKNRIEGDGWFLNLNSEWEIVQIEENYFVRKLMP
jgi:hypothetical protein